MEEFLHGAPRVDDLTLLALRQVDSALERRVASPAGDRQEAMGRPPDPDG